MKAIVTMRGKIKPLLEKGDITDVAKEFNVSISHVSRVLSGTKKNRKILDALIKKAQQSKKVKKRAEEL